MGRVLRRSVGAGEEGRVLDVYEVAFLAGGAQRVVDSAVIALSDRGLLVVRVSRVRRVGEEQQARHPVERAVIASCPRGGSIAALALHTAVQRSGEVEEIGRRLAAWGLLRDSGRRMTRLGRRRLRAAEQDGSLPAYVLGGAAVLPDGPVRRGVVGAQPIPSGLGRSLIRMGKALDRDSDSAWDSDAGAGGGFGCGGGGGSD
ncbi:TIGR04222 domain-containing membrane protein [Streptomyces lincolnensis]|uniref:TIGR04222 domain-containing membrane protein n=1 Tax=Streptomyces lincolnensis TaxID=1915 RepID=UPI001E435BC2|nr:TIGR04222 domain-containing membrane protein [Streptomyces lincolnensis]MCD7445228.1 TIGR04222 domain-containing membrane protein [Streptomyces lincolnensis]